MLTLPSCKKGDKWERATKVGVNATLVVSGNPRNTKRGVIRERGELNNLWSKNEIGVNWISRKGSVLKNTIP